MGRRHGTQMRQLRAEVEGLTRSATAQDISTLVGLMSEFHAESGYSLDRQAAAQAFERLLNNPQVGGVWLATVNNEAAGYVVLTQRYSMDDGAFTAHIEDLFVKPAHRRAGVASALLSALMEDCRRRECKSVQVEVGHDNTPAVALYQRFGLAPFTDGRILLHGPARSSERTG